MASTHPDGTPRSASFAWLHRYVEPSTSLTEILFGLIMTLTFTLGAAVLLQAGEENPRDLAIAILGCNVAWGLIDGVFYLIGARFEREQLRVLGSRVRNAPDAAAGAGLLAARLDELFAEPLAEAERQSLYQRVALHVRANPPKSTRATSEDYVGAFVTGLLVVVISLPAALPFFFIDDLFVAMRVSNAILLAFLFASGWIWAKWCTTLSPLRVGLAFLGSGLLLVLIAIPLGG
jgi:hypothetical protein